MVEIKDEAGNFYELIEHKNPQPAPQDLRPAVEWFSSLMESVLKANDHKGGWLKLGHGFLVSKLQEEVSELIDALSKPDNQNQVIREAADVANIAMMIADIAGPLIGDKPQPAPQDLRERAAHIVRQCWRVERHVDAIDEIVSFAQNYAFEVSVEKVDKIIDYIENDSMIMIPVERFFNADGSHITQKQYGKLMLEILCEELRLKFKP